MTDCVVGIARWTTVENHFPHFSNRKVEKRKIRLFQWFGFCRLLSNQVTVISSSLTQAGLGHVCGQVLILVCWPCKCIINDWWSHCTLTKCTHPSLTNRCCTEINMTGIKDILILAPPPPLFFFFAGLLTSRPQELTMFGSLATLHTQNFSVSVNNSSSTHVPPISLDFVPGQACENWCTVCMQPPQVLSTSVGSSPGARGTRRDGVEEEWRDRRWEQGRRWSGTRDCSRSWCERRQGCDTGTNHANINQGNLHLQVYNRECNAKANTS